MSDMTVSRQTLSSSPCTIPSLVPSPVVCESTYFVASAAAAVPARRLPPLPAETRQDAPLRAVGCVEALNILGDAERRTGVVALGHGRQAVRQPQDLGLGIP